MTMSALPTTFSIRRIQATPGAPAGDTSTNWSFRDLSVIVAVFFLSLLMPSTWSFYVAELRLTVYRLFLLALVIPLILRLFSGRTGKVRSFDYLMIFAGLWPLLSLSFVHDPLRALKTGGIYFVELVGSYLMGRCLVRNGRSFLAMSALFFGVVIVLAVFTIPESISGIHFLHPGAASVGRRMGFERAFGPFEHPILLGMFCAAALGIASTALSAQHGRGLGRLLRAAMVAASAMASVSSGAMAALSSQTLLMLWDRLTHGWQRRWLILLGVLALGYAAIAVYSNRTPMTVLLYYLTFNAETAYGRIVIWDFGTAEVARHPLFGIGLNSWEHPTWISDSVDNFWLCTAMMFGLPAAISMIAAILIILAGVGQRNLRDGAARCCRTGWMISMIGYSVGAATVHLWNATFVFYFFLLGCGVWLIDAPERRVPKTRAEPGAAARPRAAALPC